MKTKFKNHILQVIFLAFLIQFNLTGCDLVKRETQTPTPTPMFNDWISRFLEEKICKLPCWEGITPGKTAINEGVDILKENPGYVNVTDPIEVKSGSGDYSYASWLANQGNGRGMLWSLNSEEYVSKITLNFRGLSKAITLSDILSFFGDPQFIVVDENRGNICADSIFYEQKGMQVLIIQQCRNGKAVISKDTEIEEVSLYPLQAPGFPQVNHWLVDMDKYTTPWIGYGKYPITKVSKFQ